MGSSSSSDNAVNILCGLLWEQLTLLCSTVLWFMPLMFFLNSQATDLVTIFVIVSSAYYGLKILPDACHGTRTRKTVPARIADGIHCFFFIPI